MIHRKNSQFEWIDWYCFDKQCFDLQKKFPYRKWKKEVVKKYNAYLMVNLSDDLDYDNIYVCEYSSVDTVDGKRYFHSVEKGEK